MIECLAYNDIRPKSKVAPNGQGLLSKANELYDDSDTVFGAAFREQQQQLARFIHPRFRNLRNYWLSLGLVSRAGSSDVISPEDYLECTRAMDARWQRLASDVNFNADAQEVASYLSYEKPSFHSWPAQTWSQIARTRMFAVKTDLTRDGVYRQARMRELDHRSTHCCLQAAGKESNKRMLWSQTPFLDKPPAEFVYQSISTRGNPPVSMVFAHLKYLVGIRDQIDSGDVADFLLDVQSCYGYLQTNVDSAKTIAGIRHAEIWFNLDTTEVETVSKDDLPGAVTSSTRLCINSVAEPYPLRNTRKFLAAFEKLLKALGVQALVARTIEVSSNSGTLKTPSDYVANNYKQLRLQGEMLDVVFQAEGVDIPAHKLAMAGASPYCKAQFSGTWGENLANGARVVVGDISSATLSRIIDFAYEGSLHWPPLPAKPSNDEVANRLDELLDLLQAADMWLMSRLHDLTQQYLLTKFYTLVRADNVLEVKEKAIETRATAIEEACENFVIDNPELVRRFKEGGADA